MTGYVLRTFQSTIPLSSLYFVPNAFFVNSTHFSHLMLYILSRTTVIKLKILLTLEVMQFLYKLVLLWRHCNSQKP